MTPKRPKFSTQKLPDKGKTQLLSQVSQIFFGKSLSTSLNIFSFHFLKVCVVCVKFIFLSPSLKFYWRIHCKPKKPNFFNLVLIFWSIFPQISPKNHCLEQSQNHGLIFFSFLIHKEPTFFLNSHSVKKVFWVWHTSMLPHTKRYSIIWVFCLGRTGHMS